MIYVVEDNDDIRELVEYIFQMEGFLVKSFANATAFLKQISHTSPNLIVLDIMLPDGNGIDICNNLKLNKLTKNIPVLLMSANTNITRNGQESKANDFISKPFDIDDLVGRVRKLIS